MHTFLNHPAPFSDDVSPALVLLSGQDQERTDSLPVADAFALSPFHYSTAEPPVEPPEPATLDPQVLKRLRRLRKSPGFSVLADALLLLQAVQLDLDTPPSWPTYARHHLQAWLRTQAGKPLDPDRLQLQLSGPQVPGEAAPLPPDPFTCSLTELAIASGNPQQLGVLARCSVVDDRPLAQLPGLDASAVLRAVLDNPWLDDHQRQVDAFWQRHTRTWLRLARLAFLDGLARHRARGRISPDGYHLSLDALGYRTFATDSLALDPGLGTGQAEVRLLYIDNEVVPGLFQVRSRRNHHCFVHTLGSNEPPVEYIGNENAQIDQRLIAALNTSPWHRQWLDQYPGVQAHPSRIESRPLEGDVFTALLRAARSCAEDPPSAHGHALLDRMIARSLSLACAVDLWQIRPSILEQLPKPEAVAGELAGGWLQHHHGLVLDPRQVFIAYRPGHRRTPLGLVQHANSYVHVPDATPCSLPQALVSHYQPETPAGYVDHGAQAVVFHDPGGKGEWTEARQLPIEARAVAAFIREADFLGVMSARIDSFWQAQREPVERALRAMLVTQALVSLKTGSLQRSGFDAVVAALEPAAPGWQALAFTVQGALAEGLVSQPCASLLLCPTPMTRPVLYQAGQHKAFIEFADLPALNAYLGKACANSSWRQAVLHYVPGRHRARLDYLFRHWSGVEPVWQPASLLRPWTDILYNPDVHQTLEHALHTCSLPPGPPMAFMHQTLKANALDDARDLIVTPGQAALQYWSSRLRHLHWLLAPMSLLLTPPRIATLATELGLLGLEVAQARLPGQRQAEQRQVLLSILSLGLFGLAPQAPRLLGTLGKLGAASRTALRAPREGAPVVHSLGGWLRHALHPRQTRLEKFFHTDSLLKRWTVAPHPHFGGQPVHAWQLGRKFLLWTSNRGQARTLVVSTHGYYLPWSKTVAIPNGTQIHTYAPHGYALIDPRLHNVAARKVSPFAVSSAAGNVPVANGPALPTLTLTDKLMAGTTLPDRLKNYSLSKFQGQGGETYQEIVQVVRNGQARPLIGHPVPVPMDVLTVRNRFGSTPPTLQTLFTELAGQGIHYDRILLVHCRCAALAALSRRMPVWTALPALQPAAASP